MEFGVFFPVDHQQVIESVIRRVPVNVMHVLIAMEVPAKLLFEYESVFWDISMAISMWMVWTFNENVSGCTKKSSAFPCPTRAHLFTGGAVAVNISQMVTSVLRPFGLSPLCDRGSSPAATLTQASRDLPVRRWFGWAWMACPSLLAKCEMILEVAHWPAVLMMRAFFNRHPATTLTDVSRHSQ